MEGCVEVFVAADAVGGFMAAVDEIFLYFDCLAIGGDSGGELPVMRLEVIIVSFSLGQI